LKLLHAVNYYVRDSPLKDIDLDLAPSKLPKIFEEIRKERGEFGIVQVCTFGTEATKSAVLTACRGYRSEEYPDGIDVDDAQYISSLVPQERGFLWDLHDMIEGNPDKGRLPQRQFINTVNQYPGLLDIMRGIEGLVSRRVFTLLVSSYLMKIYSVKQLSCEQEMEI